MNDYLTTPVKVAEAPALLQGDQALLDLFGGELDLLREVATAFLECTPPLMDELHGAVAAGDAPAVTRIAHRLRGSVGNFGAEQAMEAALRLERDGSSGSLAGAEAHYTELVRAVELLRGSLERLLTARGV